MDREMSLNGSLDPGHVGVSDRGSQRIINWAICVLLVVVTVGVYSQTLGFEFVSWDDHLHVTNNPFVRQGFTLDSIRAAFTSRVTFHWHPLTMLSHMLDVQLFGMYAAGHHHAVSLLLHVLNTLLLFHLLHSVTHSRWPSAFVAAIFAVHPLHVENVAWIANRKDLLCAFFGLLSMYAYIRYARQDRLLWYALSLVFFSLGLLAKSMLVTLPFVFLLLDCWPLERLHLGEVNGFRQVAGNKGDDPAFCPKTLRGLVIEKLPLFVVAAAFVVISFVILRSTGQVKLIGQVSFQQRFVNAVVSYIWYIVKTVWPTRLAAHYVHPYLPGGIPWAGWQIAGAAVLLFAVSFIVFCVIRRRYLVVGWLWFVGTLLPVIGLVQISKQGRADRYMYIPMVGLLIMVAWGATEVATRYLSSNRGFYRKVIAGVALAVVLACMMLACSQTRHWRDSMTFYKYQLAVVPTDPYFHTNMGYLLFKEGKYEQAIDHCRRAIEIRPDLPQPHRVLVAVYWGLGEFEKAEYHDHQVQQIIALWPAN